MEKLNKIAKNIKKNVKYTFISIYGSLNTENIKTFQNLIL